MKKIVFVLYGAGLLSGVLCAMDNMGSGAKKAEKYFLINPFVQKDDAKSTLLTAAMLAMHARSYVGRPLVCITIDKYCESLKK